MHLRTRYRINTAPFLIVVACVVTLLAVLVIRQVSAFLETQMSALPLITIGVASIGPLLFLVWYLTCFADVRCGELRLRWFLRVQRVGLRTLVVAEVLPNGRTGGKRGRHKLLLRLQDSQGRELYLPLDSWRDEDLLAARVLRGVVDCNLRIQGDPALVRRFGGLLASYRSWDRKQALAA